jgi:hypothetical protein
MPRQPPRPNRTASRIDLTSTEAPRAAGAAQCEAKTRGRGRVRDVLAEHARGRRHAGLQIRGRPAGYPLTMIGFIVAGLVIGALGP